MQSAYAGPVGLGRQVTLRLPDAVVKRIDRRARDRRTTRSEIIRRILGESLEREASGLAEHPYSRVGDLIGSVSGVPTDRGSRRREYLVDLVRDRRG